MSDHRQREGHRRLSQIALHTNSQLGVIKETSTTQVRSSPLRDVKLDLVDTVDQAMELKRWLGERHDGPLGLDTETGGFSAWHDELRLVQVGDKNHGWAIPWPLWGGVALEVLNAWDGDWVLHNGPFDAKFLAVHAKWKMPWHRTHDTMTKARLDAPLRPAGLKPLSDRLVDATASQGQKFLHDGMAAQGWTWGTVPYSFAPYWVYAALDPVLTCHLDAYLSPRVEAACPDAYDLERGTIAVVTEMMLNGVLIDVPWVKDALVKLRDFSIRARAWLKDEHGVTSPMSAGQISRALNRLGREISIFTDSGQPKVDKATMSLYRDWDEEERVKQFAKVVLQVRHADKLIGTYLESFLEKMDKDHRLHGTINPMGARTHRMSSSDPNLQNLPRDDKVVRGSIVPATGFVLVTCDLSQVEARMAAHFSEDEGLIEAFHEADSGGTDFFCSIAEGIFGMPIEKIDPRRQLTKNTVYGSFYGAGARKMAATAGVPFEVMDPVKKRFDARYPGIGRHVEEIKQLALTYETPRVYLPDGRHLVADDGRAHTQLFNAEIQGHSAVYMKRALLNIAAAGLGDSLRLVIHDEAILEVPADEAEEALRIVEECMTNRTDYAVAITAEGKILPERWQK